MFGHSALLRILRGSFYNLNYEKIIAIIFIIMALNISTKKR